MTTYTETEATYGTESAFRQGDIKSFVKAGDIVTIEGFDRVFVITLGALECDCGKGLYCPLIPQPKKDEI